jgi:hypothetical protein
LLASSPDPAASDCGCVGGGVLAETIEEGGKRRAGGGSISTCGDGRVVPSRSLGREEKQVEVEVEGLRAATLRPLAVMSSCRAAAVRVVWRWRGGVANGDGWVGGWGLGVWASGGSDDVGGGAARLPAVPLALPVLAWCAAGDCEREASRSEGRAFVAALPLPPTCPPSLSRCRAQQRPPVASYSL